MKYAIRLQENSLGHLLAMSILVLLVSVLSPPKTSISAQQKQYWPTHEWKVADPEEEGLDSEILYAVDDEISANFPDIYSLLVVRGGKLVFEEYYSFGTQELIAPVYSVTKSVMSILIGIAIDQGHISSIDQKVSEFFPELFTGEIDPLKKEITIRHLLTMTAGFDWQDRGNVSWEWLYSSDLIKFTFDLDLEAPPGERFIYSTAVSHILSGILTRATGVNAQTFAEEHLFGPLGIEEIKWNQGPKGFSKGGTGLQFKARDLAKLGILYLNKGTWDNKRIVSATWVKESTGFQVKAEFDHDYGFQWWTKHINGCPSYRAWGRGGQFIVVIPNLDLVMVVTSKVEHPLAPTLHYSPLFEHIAEAVKEKNCPNRPDSDHTQEAQAGMSDRCKHLVDLPAGVSTFFDGYAKAFKEEDVEKALTYYSDTFLYDGRDKDGSKRMLSSLFSQMTIDSVCIQLNQFNQKGSIADIAGTLHLNSRSSKLVIPKIIEEDGQWKWYGDQKGAAPPASVPLEVTRFLEGYSAAITSHDKARIAQYFSKHFTSRGFTRDSYTSYATILFADVTSIEIELTTYTPKGDSAYVEGLFKTKPFGTWPLMFDRIVNEDGKWKWMGSQGNP